MASSILLTVYSRRSVTPHTHTHTTTTTTIIKDSHVNWRLMNTCPRRWIKVNYSMDLSLPTLCRWWWVRGNMSHSHNADYAHELFAVFTNHIIPGSIPTLGYFPTATNIGIYGSGTLCFCIVTYTLDCIRNSLSSGNIRSAGMTRMLLYS